MLRQLGMIGVTFRRGGQQAVARYTLPSSTEYGAALKELHGACGFSESVYLATCNRVEVVFVGDGRVPVDTYRQRFYHYFAHADRDAAIVDDDISIATAARRALHAYEGDGAAEHLFCVASALDAMSVGETQILGQVKQAYQRAQALGLVGSRLNLVFHEAFHAAKRVRTETQLGRRRVSMISLAAECIRERLRGAEAISVADPLASHFPVNAQRTRTMALVGAGDMTVQCAELCGQAPGVSLLFVNRTVARAEQLAQRFGGTFQSLADFLQDPPAVDVIVTATGAPEPIMTASFFDALIAQRRRDAERAERMHDRGIADDIDTPLVVDLAVPRDVDPQAAHHAGVQLMDVDRLEHIAHRNREARRDELAEARVIIDDALAELRRRTVDKAMGPVIQRLRRRYAATLDDALQQLQARTKGMDADIAASEVQNVMQAWAQHMLNRVAHIPMVGLKRLAAEHGLDAVEAFLAGVDDDLVDELRYGSRDNLHDHGRHTARDTAQDI